ncbi:hypothetical protein BH09BAC1_BH09BAC1_23380 [soil metagenome]
MRGLNKVTLIGHLGKDPEVTYLEGGIARARFSLATSESYNDKQGNRVDQTEWHDITFWRKQAEIAEKYLKKGSLIYLEGRLRSRSWEDNGVKKYATGVEGLTFIMLDKKEGDGGNYSGGNAGGGYGQQQGSNQAQSQPQQQQATQPQDMGGGQDFNDDLPF